MQAATPTASETQSYLPEGFRSITPYLITERAMELMDFMKNAFGAIEKMRHLEPGGRLMHGEVVIGDSFIEISDGSPRYPPSPAALHLYVPDVDAVYAQALEAGAVSLFEPADRFYGDREAGIKDAGGNQWFIASHLKSRGNHVPAGMHSITPFLISKDAERQIRFLVEGLGGTERDRYAAPDGRILHAVVDIGNGQVELGQDSAESPAVTGSIHVHVPDCDAVYYQALAAGGVSLHPLTDQPYGERSGGVLDPLGNCWWIATSKGR